MSPAQEEASPADRTIRGVLCRPDPRTPGTWRYLANVPRPAGPPQLWDLGTHASLQVQAQLDVDDAERQLLAAELGASRVDPVAATVERVELAVEDASGARTVLAQSGSSGYPPYNAVFSVSLPAHLRSLVEAALAGAGTLTITYHVTPSWPPAGGGSDRMSWSWSEQSDGTVLSTEVSASRTSPGAVHAPPITATADLRTWFSRPPSTPTRRND